MPGHSTRSYLFYILQEVILNVPCQPEQRKCRRLGLRFIVLIREEENVSQFADVVAKVAHSSQLF